MSSRRSPIRTPRGAGRRPVTLVLAALVGLLAMHGLMPGTAAPYVPSEMAGMSGTIEPTATTEATAMPGMTDPAERSPSSAPDDAAGSAAAAVGGMGVPPRPPRAWERADEAHAHQDRGGHAEHADAECAAGGVASGPPLGPPPAAPLRTGACPPAGVRGLADPPGGERAPPSLSELQLLRI